MAKKILRMTLSWLLIAFGLVPGALPAALAAEPTRLAVLPFATPKDRADLAQYSIGTMDTLVQALANVPQFTIIDKGRVQAILREQNFAQTGMVDQGTAASIGKLAGAQLLVSGEIAAVTGGISITAHVADAASGKVTKEASVSGPVGDIFDLMDQLVGKLLSEQSVQVTQQQQQRISAVTKATASLSAYDYYIKGRSAVQNFNPVDIRQGIDWYQKAIGADSRYALAYGGISEAMADLYILHTINGQSGDSDIQQAYEYGKKAVALNPDLPEALRALGLVAPPSDDPARLLRKAREISPNDAESWLYEFFRVAGNAGLPPDHQLLQKALQLNPNLVLGRLVRGIGFVNKSDIDGALREFNAVLAGSPDQALALFFVASLRIQRVIKGQVPDDQKPQLFNECIAMLRTSIRKDPGQAQAHNVLAALLNATGNRDEAIKEWEETIRLDPNNQQARQLLQQARNGG